MPTSPLVAATQVVRADVRKPGGRTSRTGPPLSAVPGAVKVIATRPHLTAEERPKVRACKCCRNKPLYNPDAALKPPSWFAEGLDMAVRWNA